MNSLIDYPEFLAQDEAYFTSLEQAQTLDPVGFNASDLPEKLRLGKPVELDELVAMAGAASRVIAIGEPASGIAAYRDLDKVFGYFACTQSRAIPGEIQAVFADSGLPHPRPRANAYEYFFGSDPTVASHAYTPDEREVNLMHVVCGSVTAAHSAVGSLLAARHLLRAGEKATDELQAAEADVQTMRSHMVAAYRSVTPEFFTLGMTRRWREVAINGHQTQGPNPSHTGFLLVDRLAGGSFEPLTQHEHMDEAFAVRRSSLPAHLNEFLVAADAQRDNKTILQLARHPADVVVAKGILAAIRRTKVAHKSHADKGLAAKGGKLTPGRPDVLTENISHFRNAEGHTPRK